MRIKMRSRIHVVLVRVSEFHPLKVTIGNSSNCVGLRPFDCL